MKNKELFDAMARFLDAPVPPPPMPLLDEKEGSNDVFQRYYSLKNDVRTKMSKTGYCFRCYNFKCGCENHE
jgi:hypothetical protein